jgi:outer membrane murein-binding lipoprotein Lpp
MDIRSRLGRIAGITAMSVMLLAGCGNSRSKEDQALIDSLTQKNQQLQAENEDLHRKLNSQDAFKSLMTAMSGRVQTASAPEHVATVPAANAHALFGDLDEATQKPMIDELTKIGLFDEMGEKFDPFKPITRGEYVAWLYKAHNKIMPAERQINMAPQATPYFKDLKPEHAAYKYAQALANAGYSVGYQDGTFRPDVPITREEMIGMKVGVDCGKTFEPYRGQMAFVWKFSDSDQIDNRFTGYIHQDYYVSGAHGNNIARAFGQIGTFRPKQPVMRCEAAGTLWQFGQFEHQGGSAARCLNATGGTTS